MNGGIDVLALALNASLFVKVVMLILLLFSLDRKSAARSKMCSNRS